MRKFAILFLLLLPSLASATNWVFVGTDVSQNRYYYAADTVKHDYVTGLTTYVEEVLFATNQFGGQYWYNGENVMMYMNCRTNIFAPSNEWVQFLNGQRVFGSADPTSQSWQPILPGTVSQMFQSALCN